MKFIQSQTSFRSGQLSRKLDGRIDIQEYRNGCYELTNMVSMKTGGVRKLPADVVFIQDFTAYTKIKTDSFVFPDGTILRFMFYSTDVVAPFNLSLRVYLNDTATVLDDIATGIQLQSVDEFISLTQYEDTIWIATGSGTQYIRGIKWDGANLLVDSTFDISTSNNPLAWPMQLANGVTVTLSGGVTPVTARTGTLSSGNWTDYASVGDYVTLVGITQDTGGNKYIAANYYKITAAAGAVATLSGWYREGFSTNDLLRNGAYGEVYFQAWNSVNGHPRIVSADDGRLIAASTIKKPATLYGSMVANSGHFNNVRQPYDIVSGTTYFGEIVNTDPYIFTIASQRTANIKFIDSNRSMIIGTDERLYVASGGDGIVGPLNIQIRPFNAKPASELYVSVNDGVLYLTSDKKRLIQFDYNTDNGTFVAQEISLLSNDLYSDGDIDELVYHEAQGLIFMRRKHTADNTYMTVLSITKETSVVSHSTYTIPKPAIGLTYIPQKNTMVVVYAYDNKFVSTLWDIDEDLKDNQSFLQMKLAANLGTPQTLWTYSVGEPGDDICYISDEGVVGFATLDGSKQFTTPPILEIRIGYCPKARVCPMPIEAGQQWGSAQMGMKRVDTVSTRFLESFSFKIKELNSQFIEEQILAQTSPSGVVPYTGVYETKLSSSPSKQQVICVENDRPEYFVVLGMSFRGVSNDG